MEHSFLDALFFQSYCHLERKKFCSHHIGMLVVMEQHFWTLGALD